MNRPELPEIPIGEAASLAPGSGTTGMSVGQWDDLLEAAYREGSTLVELDHYGWPVVAYRRLSIDVTPRLKAQNLHGQARRPGDTPSC